MCETVVLSPFFTWKVSSSQTSTVKSQFTTLRSVKHKHIFAFLAWQGSDVSTYSSPGFSCLGRRTGLTHDGKPVISLEHWPANYHIADLSHLDIIHSSCKHSISEYSLTDRELTNSAVRSIQNQYHCVQRFLPPFIKGPRPKNLCCI